MRTIAIICTTLTLSVSAFAGNCRHHNPVLDYYDEQEREQQIRVDQSLYEMELQAMFDDIAERQNEILNRLDDISLDGGKGR
jgi:hypothetical protein